MKRQDSCSEKGVVLILALLLLLVVTLIGINAINTTTFEANISGNKRASEKAFYSAEAGINEFLGRFRDGAVGAIDDASETNPLWKFYIAQNQTRAAEKGYNSSGGNHIFSQSLQTTLDYVVEVRHKVNPSTSEVIRFGVEPYYVVNSSASASGGGKKEIEIEIVKRPSYDPPSALYSEGHVHVYGSAVIQGTDRCGMVDKPGIIRTDPTPGAPTDPVETDGSPDICGGHDVDKICVKTDPGSEPIRYVATNGAQDLMLNAMMDYLKGDLDYAYSFNDNQTLSGTGTGAYPWGVPETHGSGQPLTFSGGMKIINVKMTGASNHNTLTLSGDSRGAGVLMVEGNLELSGGLNWYGVIIVTGGVKFTGGGQGKNITGGLIIGASDVPVDVQIGGSPELIYCSQVVNKINDRVKTFKTLRWGEIY